jgi:hypothetical protein
MVEQRAVRGGDEQEVLVAARAVHVDQAKRQAKRVGQRLGHAGRSREANQRGVCARPLEQRHAGIALLRLLDAQ